MGLPVRVDLVRVKVDVLLYRVMGGVVCRGRSHICVVSPKVVKIVVIAVAGRRRARGLVNRLLRTKERLLGSRLLRVRVWT